MEVGIVEWRFGNTKSEQRIVKKGVREHSVSMTWVLWIFYIDCLHVLHFPCYIHHCDPFKLLLPHYTAIFKSWLLLKDSS